MEYPILYLREKMFFFEFLLFSCSNIYWFVCSQTLVIWEYMGASFCWYGNWMYMCNTPIYNIYVHTSNFNVMPKIGHIYLFKKCITSNSLDIVYIIYSD